MKKARARKDQARAAEAAESEWTRQPRGSVEKKAPGLFRTLFKYTIPKPEGGATIHSCSVATLASSTSPLREPYAYET